MPYNSNTVSSVMTCPVCGDGFNDIHEFAAHLNKHSQEEKKRKAEEDKKEREAQRNKDIENLLNLKAECNVAEKKLENAFDAYRKKYGLVFPTYVENIDITNRIGDLLRFFGF